MVFSIPVAMTVDKQIIESAIEGKKATFKLYYDDLYGVLNEAEIAITASGTVTLEAALSATPMIIVYKMSSFSFWLGKRIIRVKYIGWPNLIAGKEIAPELIQDDVSPGNIARIASSMLRDKPGLLNVRKELGAVAKSLGAPGASRRAARIALRLLN